MKKLLCTALLLVFTVGLFCFAPVSAETPAFDADGNYKILIIADPQDAGSLEEPTRILLEAELDAAQPDLVVFLGDIVHGPTAGGEQAVLALIDETVSPVVSRGIPFAVVFGNHDDEGGVSKEVQMEKYMSYPGCLSVPGECESGCGNYFVDISGRDGSFAARLWFVDSGSYAPKGEGLYDYVHDDQLAWMRENAQSGVPQYLFQHIPVPETYDMLKSVDKNTDGAVKGVSGHEGEWFVADSEYISAGTLGEAPCSPEHNSGEFAVFREMGLDAAFFGHDHVNDYEGRLDGVEMIATTGLGFYIYGAGERHGARLVTLHESRGFDTEMLYWADVTDAALPNMLISEAGSVVRDYIYVAAAVLAVIAVAVIVLIVLLRRAKKKKLAALPEAPEEAAEPLPVEVNQ